MEDLLAIGMDGEETNFDKLFRRAIGVLDSARYSYVLAGALALDLYVPPRFTDQIHILCQHNEHAPIASALAASGFAITQSAPSIATLKAADAKGYIVLNGSDSSAMRYALMHATQRQVFSVTARVVSPQALLWLFLESDEIQHHADAIALIESGLVSPEEIQDLLTREGAGAALAKYMNLWADIRDGRYARTYSDSVKARVLRNRKNDAERRR
ncbi:hypothetical protein OYT1_ch0086 [Ferriphaselus amnicola]|uniref:Uncharacterized protein n=1 Tax=Ferriphaselus amnicola TaxID=1188319 RepID=A0A2Z6G872_9PROT|nr:hypothetical protein [Ferriphaselus amnicola]BBE49662.1 hypothetical protein OYT1_ch0086 [Ferriphaselus amnicola]